MKLIPLSPSVRCLFCLGQTVSCGAGGDKNECTKQSNETIKILEDKSNGDADDYHNDYCYAVVKDEFETL